MLQPEGIIDNVHMSNVNIKMTGNGYVGGLARQAWVSTIKNSSINNINIIVERNQNQRDRSFIGGIVRPYG